MGTRLLRGSVTLVEHGEGLARYERENIGKENVIYTGRKRFL